MWTRAWHFSGVFHSPFPLPSLHADRPIWVCDDLEAVGKELSPELLKHRPETGACLEALKLLQSAGQIRSAERVVIFNTGAAQKYVEARRTDLPRIDRNQPIDGGRLEQLDV